MNRPERLLRLREYLRSNLWFVPGVYVLLAIALALALIAFDHRLDDVADVSFVFGGSAEAARSVLSVIAGSMVSLTALVFSILVVVFQLASSQFTPRALRSFIRDRASKVALGTFLGTFAFSLTVLRAVRSPDGAVEEFVPRLSVTAAFAASILSMAVFVYYIHHVSGSIRANAILRRIHTETAAVIARLLPEDGSNGRSGELPAGVQRRLPDRRADLRTVRADAMGYITSVDAPALLREAAEGGLTVWLGHEVGTFISRGRPLLEVRPADREVDERRLLATVHLGSERTMEQDLGYGFRQLADIAVRALSPGVNDPTTAAMAIDHMEDLLLDAGRRPLTHVVLVDEQGGERVHLPRQTWESLIHEALQETMFYGKESPQVAERLHALLATLQEELPPERMRSVYREATRAGLLPPEVA